MMTIHYSDLYTDGHALRSPAACRLVMSCAGYPLTANVPQSDAIAAWHRLPKTLDEAKACGLADDDCDLRNYELASVFLRKAATNPRGFDVFPRGIIARRPGS